MHAFNVQREKKYQANYFVPENKIAMIELHLTTNIAIYSSKKCFPSYSVTTHCDHPKGIINAGGITQVYLCHPLALIVTTQSSGPPKCDHTP